MNKTMVANFAFSGLTLVLLSACARWNSTDVAVSGGKVDSLADTNWIVERSVSGAGAALKPLTLSFIGHERIAGHDGCNAFNGTVTVKKESLAVSDKLAGTLMACSDAIDSRARAFRADLLHVQRYAIKDTKLELADSSGNVLFVLAPAPTSLAGSWNAVSYNNGKQAVTSVISGTKISTVFGGDGRISGNAGCNSYFADYTTSGETIAITTPGATKRACMNPEGVMAQEAQFLQALTTAAQFRITTDQLELRTAAGSIVAIFSRSATVVIE